MHEREHPSYWMAHANFGPVILRGVRTDVEVRHHWDTDRHEPRTFLDSEMHLLTTSGARLPTLFAGGQAFYYPADAAVLIAVLTLNPAYGQGTDPREDFPLRQVWRRYEMSLQTRFPHARRLLTGWNETYPRPQWSGFLSGLGYTLVQPAVFARRL